MTCLFENLDTYEAILDHRDVNIGFTMTDINGNSEVWNLSKAKLLDGGPNGPGNNAQAVLEVPFMAKFDADDDASITIARTAGS